MVSSDKPKKVGKLGKPGKGSERPKAHWSIDSKLALHSKHFEKQ